MLKLSAKNKKMFSSAFMWFGVIVLVAAIVRAVQSGVKNIGDGAKVVWSDLKQIVSFTSVIVFLLSVFFFILDSFLGTAGLVLAVALGTLVTGAGVVTTFNTTYVPKQFFYVAATQLTGVKITVQGEGVIFDSDAPGLNHTGTNRLMGQITNGYTFRLTNGFIPGKNVIWEFTNSAAQTPTIYVSSDETQARGQQMYLQLLRQAVLANSGQNFGDFATLSLPALAAGDEVNALYRDGTQQSLNRQDIQAMLGFTQNILNTPIYLLDNFAQKFKTVNVIAGAAQTAYVQRWVPVTSGGMINQSINN